MTDALVLFILGGQRVTYAALYRVFFYNSKSHPSSLHFNNSIGWSYTLLFRLKGY